MAAVAVVLLAGLLISLLYPFVSLTYYQVPSSTFLSALGPFLCLCEGAVLT
jgi:hypothetical protein